MSPKAPDVEAMVSKAMETYAQLDYAHNNAGVEGIREVPPAPIADCTEENWDYTININLKGIMVVYEVRNPSYGHERRGSYRKYIISPRAGRRSA